MRAGPSAPALGSAAGGDPVFGSVLVGVDTTPESLIAAAQARCLCAPGGSLEVLAVAETHRAAHAGVAAPYAADGVVAATRDELDHVRELVEPDAVRLVGGSIADTLVAEARRRASTLVALGTARHRRLAARLLGGPDLPLIRDAPCSVLVARSGWGPCKPSRILVGIDGSPAAEAVEQVGGSLARRLGCELTPVIALGASPFDTAALRGWRAGALLDTRSQVEALVAAPEDCLVLVGAGTQLATDIAARVAHEAACSVLVVRGEPGAGV